MSEPHPDDPHRYSKLLKAAAAPEPRVMPRDVLREALEEVFEPYLRLLGADPERTRAILDGATARLSAYHDVAVLSESNVNDGQDHGAASVAADLRAAPTPSRKAADALLDAVEQAVQSEALPANIHARLRDAFNEVVDQANKTTLAKHGLVFEDSDAGVERCICDYDRPSRVKVGCPVHYPDPGADAEGETA